MTDRKSPNMAKLLEENVNIKEAVTDAHLGIGSIMSNVAEYYQC